VWSPKKILPVVFAGLAIGVILILAITLIGRSADGRPLRWNDDFIRAANNLDEVKIFLDKYPTYKVAVEREPDPQPPSTTYVTYTFADDPRAKIAFLRVTMHPDGKSTYFQIRCYSLLGSNNTAIYGPKVDVSIFLQDPRCP